MRTHNRGESLFITDIPTLNADTSQAFREFARAGLRAEHKTVDVDLSRARSVDSDGLGALISVHKAVCQRGGQVRLLQPSPLIADMIKLLQLDRLFQIIPR